MNWMLRRLLGPLLVGTVICTVLLLVWLSVETGDSLAPVTLSDAVLSFLIVLTFETVGLVLLLPIALVLGGQSLPHPLFPPLLSAIGGLIGMAVVLPIGQSDLWLAATCGAVSALVWLSFNRDVIKRQA